MSAPCASRSGMSSGSASAPTTVKWAPASITSLPRSHDSNQGPDAVPAVTFGMVPRSDGVGVDVGSTTAKIVVVRGGAVVHRAYARHHGRCREAAERLLRQADVRGPVRVTGSAGSALAEVLGGAYVHEVHAVATAV